MTTNQILLGGGLILVTGVILVVSVPTVVGPLFSYVRPVERRIVVWEGSPTDPVGGILGALVFHGVVASADLKNVEAPLMTRAACRRRVDASDS